MRRTLFATTALALASAFATSHAVAADMLSVGVGGYMEQWFGVSSVDAVDKDGKATDVEGGVAQQSDSEIHFKGKLETDTGLTFSVKVELEGNTHGSQIDESQVTVRGTFGSITLGAEDGASVLTHHGVRDAGIGITCGDTGNWINGIKGCGPGGFGTAGHGLGDKNSISYFTPRVNGVQFGATYIPNTGQEGQAADLNNNDNDAWSIGGNYKGDMGGASVAVSAGYYQASQTMDAIPLKSGMNDGKITVGQFEMNDKAIKAYAKGLDEGAGDIAALASAAADAEASNKGAFDTMASKSDSRTIANFGLQVGLGSFSFDVAYMAGDGGKYMEAKRPIAGEPDGQDFDHDGNADTPMVPETADLNNPDNDTARTVLVKDTSADFETVAVGVMYSDGPMAVSLAHSMVDADDGAEQSGTMLSMSYKLAPGVTSKTSLFAAERDNADGSGVEGSGFVTGIAISF